MLGLFSSGILPSATDFHSELNYRRADETISEVFASMLGLAVQSLPAGTAVQTPTSQRTAIVGFSGAMRGCCEIRMDHEASACVASMMLGGVTVEDEESLNDAVGELCNMVAGGWKDRVPDLSAQCALSPPTVITGVGFKVNLSRPAGQIVRCYTFSDYCLWLNLHREEGG